MVRSQSGDRSRKGDKMADAKTRGEKLNRLYENRDGEVVNKITQNVKKVIIEVIGTGERVIFDLTDISPDGQLPNECMLMAAAAFGMNTVLGNQVAGATDPTEMAKRIQDRAEAIIEGEWATGREGGPKLSLVVEAWKASLAARGHQVSDDQLAAMRKSIVDGEYSTKDLLADEHINAEFRSIEARVAVERAEKAKAAAVAKPAGDIDPRFLPKA